MENRNESLINEELEVEGFGAWLADMWLKNFREVRRYIEPTVQLLIRKGYQAGSVLMPGCHLVALNPDHLLVGFVAHGKWPSGIYVELLHAMLVPRGTKRVVFRWHNLRGIPDWKEI